MVWRQASTQALTLTLGDKKRVSDELGTMSLHIYS